MIVFRGATLIDGTGAGPIADAAVGVEGERITQVGGKAPRGADVLDLEGLTLLPGLIDGHTHLGIIDPFDGARVPPAVDAAHIFRNCGLALDEGFTTVRDLGGLDGGVAQAVAQGLVRGPRIFPSGPVLCQSGGHSDLSPPWLPHWHGPGVPGLAQLSIVCDGPDEVRRAARTALRRGATQVKVCVSGGVLSFTDRLEDTQFTVEELRAAVGEAKARDTYVAAHAHGVEGMKNALAAGVACIEHGTFLDAETAQAMATAGAALCPTFAVIRMLSAEWKERGIPEQMIPRLGGVEEAMTGAVKFARDAGVLIGSGSDLFGAGQTRRALEITRKAEILSPMEAIVSATSANAKILRASDRLGSVEEGKLADLIAVNGDPLATPEVLEDSSRLVLVMKGGEIVKDSRER